MVEFLVGWLGWLLDFGTLELWEWIEIVAEFVDCIFYFLWDKHFHDIGAYYFWPIKLCSTKPRRQERNQWKEFHLWSQDDDNSKECKSAEPIKPLLFVSFARRKLMFVVEAVVVSMWAETVDIDRYFMCPNERFCIYRLYTLIPLCSLTWGRRVLWKPFPFRIACLWENPYCGMKCSSMYVSIKSNLYTLEGMEERAL